MWRFALFKSVILLVAHFDRYFFKRFPFTEPGVRCRIEESHEQDPNETVAWSGQGILIFLHKNISGTNKTMKHKGNPRFLRITICDRVFNSILGTDVGFLNASDRWYELSRKHKRCIDLKTKYGLHERVYARDYRLKFECHEVWSPKVWQSLPQGPRNLSSVFTITKRLLLSPQGKPHWVQRQK